MPRQKAKITGITLYYDKIAKNLQNQPEFIAFLQQKAKEGEQALKEAILENRTSHDPKRTPEQIRHAAEYQASVVQSKIKKGRKRSIVVVFTGAHDAVEYEAEHGNTVRAKNKMKSRNQ